jgi:hypothetical protein
VEYQELQEGLWRDEEKRDSIRLSSGSAIAKKPVGNFGSSHLDKLVKIRGLEGTSGKNAMIKMQKEIWRLIEKRDGREYKVNTMNKKVEFTKIKLRKLRAECQKLDSPRLNGMSIESLKEQLQQQKNENFELELREESAITEKKKKIDTLKQKNYQLEELCYRVTRGLKSKTKPS